jgi:hypothetical protein
MHPYLTDKAVRQMEERAKVELEAFELLDLIVAEFESDPMSVQCFDLRIVDRAKKCVADLKKTKSVFG